MADAGGSDVVTIAAIAAVAYAAADVTHEAAHVLVRAIVGVKVVTVSSVGVQAIGRSPLASSAGTTVEVLAGGAALAFAARARRDVSLTVFLWLFGAVAIMNVGYLAFSAVSASGDWASVVAGLQPQWLWRAILCAIGIVGYRGAVSAAARVMQTVVRRADTRIADIRQLILPAYLSGGVVMTVASAFNPLGWSLVLVSGAGASFGLSAGLLFIGGSSPVVPRDARWIAIGMLVAIAFVAAFGRGISA